MKLILVITALVKLAENFTFRLWNSSHFNGSITWLSITTKFYNLEEFILTAKRIHLPSQIKLQLFPPLC